MKHSLKEIERYYASKARYTPHVVGHYAAGARVEGLTDKELRKTWQDLSQASKGKNSPYAQPLNFVISTNRGAGYKKKTIRSRKKQVGQTPSPSPVPHRDKSPSHFSSRNRSNSASPSILKQSRNNSPLTEESLTPSPNLFFNEGRDSAMMEFSPPSSGYGYHKQKCPPSRCKSRAESTIGWTPRHRLPITQERLPVVAFCRDKDLTIKDMKKIRKKVCSARHGYYNKLVCEKEMNALDYWDALKVEAIPSVRLRNTFRKCFQAYSPTNTYNEYKSALNQGRPKSRPISPDTNLTLAC